MSSPNSESVFDFSSCRVKCNAIASIFAVGAVPIAGYGFLGFTVPFGHKHSNSTLLGPNTIQKSDVKFTEARDPLKCGRRPRRTVSESSWKILLN